MCMCCSVLSERRVTQIKTYSWDNAQVVLVGNKADLESARAVSAERAHKLARQLGLEFYETSAKDNTRVSEVRPLPSTFRSPQVAATPLD